MHEKTIEFLLEKYAQAHAAGLGEAAAMYLYRADALRREPAAWPSAATHA